MTEHHTKSGSGRLLRRDMRHELERFKAIRSSWAGDADAKTIAEFDRIIARLERFHLKERSTDQ